MKDEAKVWFREMLTGVGERALRELEARPVFVDDGEELVITMRVFYTRDRSRPWEEKPDVDGEGTYIGATVTVAHTESL